MKPGDLIKQIRASMGLSQREFAKIIGVSPANVNKWERHVSEPTYKSARKIIEAVKNNVAVYKLLKELGVPFEVISFVKDFTGRPNSKKNPG